jgi:shikimate dehydrogenase
MINGHTEIIAHLGYPTETFTAPMIYNPWFASRGINAVVVPMGVRAEGYAAFLGPLFRLSNIRGALVTMPHKVATVGLLDEAAVAVQVAGACNAILCRPDGSLYGDLFDGIGFVRGAKRKGFDFPGADCLIVGAGGVGSAIAAAIAAEGAGSDRALRHRRRGGRTARGPSAAPLPRPGRQAAGQRPRRISPGGQRDTARDVGG